MTRTLPQAQPPSPTTAPLLSHPVHRAAVRDLVLRAVGSIEPAELKIAEALLDPLLERAARGQPLEPAGRTARGGFGAAELAVFALVPLVVHAVARLVRELGRSWPQETSGLRLEISVPEAKAVLRDFGWSGSAHEVAELVRAVQEALLAHGMGHRRSLDVPARWNTTLRDLALRIEADGAGDYRTRVLATSGGGAAAPFAPPRSRFELERLLRRLERIVPAGARHTVPVSSPPEDGEDPGAFGGDLYEALFDGGVRGAFEHRRPAIHETAGLRLRLVLDPRDPFLLAHPWELLADRRTGLFVGLDPRTPIVRHLELDAPVDPHPGPTTPPLRVLVAWALARGHAALAAGEEVARIEGSIRERSKIRAESVEVETLEQVTVGRLRRAVKDFSPHVLHFIGHGALDAGNAEAGMILVDPGRDADPLTGGALATVLQGSADLRLVVLNACHTAALPRRAGLDAFSGLAPALIRGGRPAVVAMQFPISDAAAVAFAEALYRHLAAGDSVEGAVTEGRQAIFDLDRRYGSFEWATPVLYLGVEGGDLFHFRTGR